MATSREQNINVVIMSDDTDKDIRLLTKHGAIKANHHFEYTSHDIRLIYYILPPPRQEDTNDVEHLQDPEVTKNIQRYLNADIIVYPDEARKSFYKAFKAEAMIMAFFTKNIVDPTVIAADKILKKRQQCSVTPTILIPPIKPEEPLVSPAVEEKKSIIDKIFNFLGQEKNKTPPTPKEEKLKSERKKIF